MNIIKWNAKIFYFMLLLIPLLIIVFHFCSEENQKESLLPLDFIKTAKVSQKEFVRTVIGYGFIIPMQKENILAYSRGKIEKIWVREGEEVSKGETLLSIKGLASIHEINLIRSRLESTQAEYERMQKKFKRIQELEKERATYAKEQENIYANYKKAQALFHAARQEYNFYTTGLIIESPIDGVIADLKKLSGRTIEAGEFLLAIISYKNLLAEVQIFGTDSYLVKANQEAILSNKTGTYTGRVYFLSKIIDGASGARRIGIKINVEENGKLLSGDFVRSEIIVAKHSSLAIPQKALLRDNKQAFVIVKVGEKYIAREIEAGLSNHGYVEILNGLKMNEEIVIIGAYELLNRDIVDKIILED